MPLVVAPREAQGDSTMAEPSVEKKKKRERARTGRLLQKSKLVVCTPVRIISNNTLMCTAVGSQCVFLRRARRARSILFCDGHSQVRMHGVVASRSAAPGRARGVGARPAGVVRLGGVVGSVGMCCVGRERMDAQWRLRVTRVRRQLRAHKRKHPSTSHLVCELPCELPLSTDAVTLKP